jgi:hypothetical protein
MSAKLCAIFSLARSSTSTIQTKESFELKCLYICVWVEHEAPIYSGSQNSHLHVGHQGVVCCLGSVVAVKQERIIARSPAVLIRNTPNSDADTLGNTNTPIDDSPVVTGRSTRDIKLSDGNLRDVGGSKRSQSSWDTRRWVPSTGSGQVSLCSDTIDGDTLRQPLVNVSNHTRCDLGVGSDIKIVVIDIEFGIWISGASSAESNTNEVLTENTAEDTVTEVSILSEDLVDDVPVGNLSFVAGDQCSNVVLNDRRQGVAVADCTDPAWQLGVPEESVSTDLLAILSGEVDNVVGVGERE